MRKYPDFGPEEKPEPYPLGKIVVGPIKPIVDDEGKPIPPEENEYRKIGKY